MFRTVCEFNKNNNAVQIRRLLKVLPQEFTTSRDAHKRKGGLLGLAAISIGLGKVSILTRRVYMRIAHKMP